MFLRDDDHIWSLVDCSSHQGLRVVVVVIYGLLGLAIVVVVVAIGGALPQVRGKFIWLI